MTQTMHNTMHCHRFVMCTVRAHCTCSHASSECRELCLVRLFTTPPTSPALSRHQDYVATSNNRTLSRQRKLSRDRLQSSIEAPLSRHQGSCRDTKPSHDAAPLSQHQNCVATPKAPCYLTPCRDIKTYVAT